ncbi:MAG: aconitate hydratase AcnA [Anaerolineaceae bacterium]|nr:aconitate hydratase AcnA [Anaerolineaceae bacterium]
MKGLKTTLNTFETREGKFTYYALDQLPHTNKSYYERLPFSICVLLEGVLRNMDGENFTIEHANYLANWKPVEAERKSIPFFPGRTVLQDFTGVPVMNDLAAMRDAIIKLGGDPLSINPVIPVDLVIDHSVQVDYAGQSDALEKNAQIEFERNRERYEFLRWSEKAFKNFRIVPPATGIVHQVNLEYLSQVVLTKKEGDQTIAYPDTLIGTDSHTTMINGLGIVGWGVGGIEAVAAMMGQPLEILAPDVIGIELSGSLPEGTTPTDLTLTIIQMLRQKGVVGKFVEFFGPALESLTLADRAMIANMTPESGATMIFFPVDQQTLNYLKLTNKPDSHLELVETYCKAQHIFHHKNSTKADYTETIQVNLADIEPSLAGPKRPQDRIKLSDMQSSFSESKQKSKVEKGFGIPKNEQNKSVQLNYHGKQFQVGHGFLTIAAITSCTNTSNPTVMVAAGLLAKKAVEKGLSVPEYVKTSFAPGSRVVTEYLKNSGLMSKLDQLGFNIVGYGCTTCIGNSGPLAPEIVETIETHKLVASAVLSGNRNFEGRVSPHTVANYLASPPLVVAYALAGTVDINLTEDPIGTDPSGNPVYLADIWPSSQEINAILRSTVSPQLFNSSYADVYEGNQTWNQIQAETHPIYTWNPDSTYLQKPPFFEDLLLENGKHAHTIQNARVLLKLGDSVTTDHISPAGAIPASGPAGKFLLAHDVPMTAFNSFGSRRGNDLIMSRGTFANIRIKNLLVPGSEGGVTKFFPTGEVTTIYDASQKYQDLDVPLIVLAGKEYGTGSSRDWAAKGPALLGVKAVIAESFERIHRSNLVGMGILPLQYKPGENAQTLNLDGTETFDINVKGSFSPGSLVNITATKTDGSQVQFETILRIDTRIEITYYEKGGIMNAILLNSL